MRTVKVAPGSCSVQLESGEIVRPARWSARCPRAPFRDLVVEGVSDARLESLHRQRHALAAKFVAAYDRPFWRDRGQNGLTESEGILGSSWPQNEGVLSCLVPPERFAAYLSTGARHRREEALAELGDWFGPEALTPIVTFERLWGTDPWTQGYVTQWRPGDVHRVGRYTVPTSPVLRVWLRCNGWPATWKARCAPDVRGLGSAGAGMTEIEVLDLPPRAIRDARPDRACCRAHPTSTPRPRGRIDWPPAGQRSATAKKKKKGSKKPVSVRALIPVDTQRATVLHLKKIFN